MSSVAEAPAARAGTGPEPATVPSTLTAAIAAAAAVPVLRLMADGSNRPPEGAGDQVRSVTTRSGAGGLSEDLDLGDLGAGRHQCWKEERQPEVRCVSR